MEYKEIALRILLLLIVVLAGSVIYNKIEGFTAAATTVAATTSAATTAAPVSSLGLDEETSLFGIDNAFDDVYLECDDGENTIDGKKVCFRNSFKHKMSPSNRADTECYYCMYKKMVDDGKVGNIKLTKKQHSKISKMIKPIFDTYNVSCKHCVDPAFTKKKVVIPANTTVYLNVCPSSTPKDNGVQKKNNEDYILSEDEYGTYYDNYCGGDNTLTQCIGKYTHQQKKKDDLPRLAK